ncbi:MAG: hypothetical protein JWO13_3077 [Acidobacteriales bacterium]|nr:hypothetical protein [Terriglobales bacterium]
MKNLFWVGIVVLILGVLSLFVPIPQTQHEGIKAGGLSIGVETRTEEKVSPIISAVLILGGAGMAIGAKAKA